MPGTDYEPLEQVLDFAANQTSRTVAVTLLTGSNLTVDGARTIKLDLDQAEPPGLASVGAPRLATVTIGDNDLGGTIQFSPTSLSALETDGERGVHRDSDRRRGAWAWARRGRSLGRHAQCTARTSTGP